ncbi:Ig-like domain-containing protein [Candidatus Pseudoruminococcus sp.]|uniref:Ig-like domain-containing protein n=1 Tax=Candidatus Pseudoruminococcus sp. TaxID=3101048 RepID=UPI00399BC538
MQDKLKSIKIPSIMLFILITLSLFQFPANAASQGIVLDKNDISLAVGNSYQLKWTVIPSKDSQDATFYSKDTNIANVSTGGLIIATGKGSTEIVITSGDGLNFTTCKVKVTENKNTEVINLAESELYLRKGSSSSIFYNFNKDEYVFSKTSNFSSNDEKIASVNEDGTIKAIENGSATINATFGKITRLCKVNVGEGAEYVSGRKVSGTFLNASNKFYKNTTIAISYTKKKKNYYATATTDAFGNFTFNGIKDGTYTLSYYDNSSKKVIHSNKITVSGKDIKYTAIFNKGTIIAVQGELKSEENTIPKTVSLSKEYLSMNIGDIKELNITTTPRDADITKLKITSSDKSVVDINDKGELVAIKSGYADITYKTPDGKSSAVCKVNVLEAESTQYSLIYISAIFLIVFILFLWFVKLYKKFIIQKKLREDTLD